MPKVVTMTYSERIPGARGNYNWPVRYDISTEGYLSITQFDGETVKDRVLMSPKQVRELVEFVQKRKKS